ncbi:MAG: hypothetical protein Q9227_002681 [Pyrenula ochraceoflavens]
MDYLITEGYPSAARKFAMEANVQPKTDFDSIQERVEIRESIHKGDLQTAIEKINELNPQYDLQQPLVHALLPYYGLSNPLTSPSHQKKLLDTDASLHFSLLRLQLIELIRPAMSSPNHDPDISAAIDFATTHLAPRAPTNPSFLADLERTMALLIFPPVNLSPELATLVDPNLRREVAQRVNEAILHSQGAKREAKIRDLVRLRMWSEKKARELKKDIPNENEGGLDLGLLVGADNATKEDGGAANGSAGGNGTAMEGVTTEGGGVPLPVAMET